MVKKEHGIKVWTHSHFEDFNCGVWRERYALSSLIVSRYHLIPSVFLMTVKTRATHVTVTEHGINHSRIGFVTAPVPPPPLRQHHSNTAQIHSHSQPTLYCGWLETSARLGHNNPPAVGTLVLFSWMKAVALQIFKPIFVLFCSRSNMYILNIRIAL